MRQTGTRGNVTFCFFILLKLKMTTFFSLVFRSISSPASISSSLLFFRKRIIVFLVNWKIEASRKKERGGDFVERFLPMMSAKEMEKFLIRQ